MNAALRVKSPAINNAPVTTSMAPPTPNRLNSGCAPGWAPAGKPTTLIKPWARKMVPDVTRSAASVSGATCASIDLRMDKIFSIWCSVLGYVAPSANGEASSGQRCVPSGESEGDDRECDPDHHQLDLGP